MFVRRQRAPFPPPTPNVPLPKGAVVGGFADAAFRLECCQFLMPVESNLRTSVVGNKKA